MSSISTINRTAFVRSGLSDIDLNYTDFWKVAHGPVSNMFSGKYMSMCNTHSYDSQREFDDFGLVVVCVEVKR